jgi:hypothetical protein
MVQAVVDPESGELATEYCPRRVKQWFRVGLEPREECHLHPAPAETEMATDSNGAPSGNDANDPIKAVGRSIGSILRRIIHW